MKLSLLLIMACMTATVGAGLLRVLEIQTNTAKPGEIIAASDLSKAELKIMKASVEKQPIRSARHETH